MDFHNRLRLEHYEPFIGAEVVDRIYQKARKLEHLHVANIIQPTTAGEWRSFCLLIPC